MSEDVAVGLNRLANTQGRTLYSLINDLGTCALEAGRLGFSLEEAVAALKFVQSAKKSRMVIVNQDLWYFASAQAMAASKGDWTKLVQKSGQWDANVLLGGREDQRSGETEEEFVASVKKFAADYLWDCSDVRLEREKGEEDGLLLRLTFVPEMPLEHTRSLFKLFEAVFNTRGYVPVSSNVAPGFLSASFRMAEKKALGT